MGPHWLLAEMLVAERARTVGHSALPDAPVRRDPRPTRLRRVVSVAVGALRRTEINVPAPTACSRAASLE